jgi:hypothetical protein
MGIAQKLYESGLITYMRTDSFNIAQSAREECAKYIEDKFGKDYLPQKPNFYKSKSSAQEAHEAIRPTDVNRDPDSMKNTLTEEEWKLYKLIWSRFVASQMAPAKISRLSVEIANNSGENEYLFRVTSSHIIFPGYMAASGIESPTNKILKKDGEAEESVEVEKLPELEKGEKLAVLKWHSEQKFTKPPARYTEASLIKALEENGVGRPSTYAQTLSTLDQREYIEKENRSLKPTESGMRVNKFLTDNPDFPSLAALFDVNFTAGMEEQLDRIERGDIEWTAMMKRFFETLKSSIKPPEADSEFLGEVLKLLSHVKDWRPSYKQGRRTYDDKKMFEEIREKFEKGEPVSKRQCDALFSMACRYEEQIPSFQDFIDKFNKQVEYEKAKKDSEPPDELTIKKLKLMENIKFDEPRKVRNRKYDDKKFIKSLSDQVQGGKKLTENQINYLHKLIIKYKDQIDNYEKLADELGITAEVKAVEDPVIGEILSLLDNIKEWNPPVKRGKREFNDESFYNSLKSQYEMKGSLTPKQVAALKKMVARYGYLIPNYDDLMEKYGLPPAKQPKKKKE